MGSTVKWVALTFLLPAVVPLLLKLLVELVRSRILPPKYSSLLVSAFEDAGKVFERQIGRREYALVYAFAVFGYLVAEVRHQWPPSPLKYDFEHPGRLWTTPNRPEHGLGLSEPGWHKDWKAHGDASMSVKVNLRTDGTKECPTCFGETLAYVVALPPDGDKRGISSLSLRGRRITAYAHIPPSLVSHTDNRTYLDLFAIECDPPFERHAIVARAAGEMRYGRDIISAGDMYLDLRLPWRAKKICRIGVKIGMNENDPNASYSGMMAIDAVDWGWF